MLLSLSSVVSVVVAAVVGALLAWLMATLRCRALLAEQHVLLMQAEQAKTKAQELALQARQQVESLQHALSEAKREGAQNQAARAAAAAAEAAEAAKARARAELLRQLEEQDRKAPVAHGFADTEPLLNKH